MTTEIQEYSKTEAALAELRQRFEATVFDVTTTAGMKLAVAARAEVRGYRTGLEKLRKEIKAPALARCNAIDTEAKRITLALEALEGPIDAQIKAEESRKEQERQAKLAAEQARIDGIRANIDSIRGRVTAATGQPSAWVSEILDGVRGLVIDAERFAEFVDNAKAAKADTIEALERLLAATEAQEAEALRLMAERDELARLRADEDARQAKERERLADEQAAARTQREAEESRARAERAEADRQAAAQREAEERRLAAERARLQAEADELARQRAAIEAAERRQLAERAAKKHDDEQAFVAEAIASRPTDDQIIETLALRFRAHEMTVIGWLLDMDLDAVSKRVAKEFA